MDHTMKGNLKRKMDALGLNKPGYYGDLSGKAHTRITPQQLPFIFAPSGSGKSYLVNRGLAIDGDDIISAGIGWPKQERWWETMNTTQRNRVRKDIDSYLLRWAMKRMGMLTKPIVFVKPTESMQSSFRALTFAIVIRPPRRHRLNLIARLQSGNTWQPGPEQWVSGQMKKSRTRYRQLSRQHKIPVYQHFTHAVHDWQKWHRINHLIDQPELL